MKKIAVIILACIIFLWPLMGTYAAVTGISFGGKVFYRYPCTCTAGLVYYLVMGPPKAGLALSYVLGTQGFSKYSLPAGIQIKGLYNPLVTNNCIMGVYPYCYTLYSRGTITYMVGNSI